MKSPLRSTASSIRIRCFTLVKVVNLATPLSLANAFRPVALRPRLSTGLPFTNLCVRRQLNKIIPTNRYYTSRRPENLVPKETLCKIFILSRNFVIEFLVGSRSSLSLLTVAPSMQQICGEHVTVWLHCLAPFNLFPAQCDLRHNSVGVPV